MENNTVEKKKRVSRPQTLGEEIGNSITHGIGFIAGIVGTILLLIKADTVAEYIGCTIFGMGMMTLYLMSCLYHSFKNGTLVKRIFKRFDHLSIYLLIGGTFAPILLCVIERPVGIIFFVVQWILILIGVILKAINTQKYHVLHIILYLLLGWCGIFFVGQLVAISPNLFLYVLLGGLSYSIGVAFYASKFKYSHFVWHFFVLGGTVLQFIGIYQYIL